MRRVRITGVALAVAAAASVGAIAGTQQDTVRFDGEYGLWVSERGDSIEVRWITREPAAGYLQVLEGDSILFQNETAASAAHGAIFQTASPSILTLRYGAVGDPRDHHETAIYFDLPQRPLQTEFSDVDTLFVVGDVHGEYEKLCELFRNAGLVDEGANWTGGRKNLVLLGDLFDRGPDVLRTLWFLYRLERQAERHGGRVHVVLGNHEIMAMTDDARYVSGKELHGARLHGADYWQMFDPRSSILGKWLASKPALIRIDGVLLAHGSVGPAYAGYSIGEFDDSLATFMSEDWFYFLADTTVVMPPIDSLALDRRINFFFAPNSVFWYRDYLETDTLTSVLDHVLERFDSEIHVVGHTPFETIQQRYDGALIGVDLEDPASELLMLVRSADGYERYSYPLSGPPVPLPLPVQASEPR